jgi:hypothetical protein
MSCADASYDERNYVLLMWSHALHLPPNHLDCGVKVTLLQPCKKNYISILILGNKQTKHKQPQPSPTPVPSAKISTMTECRMYDPSPLSSHKYSTSTSVSFSSLLPLQCKN